jgi:N-acetylglucosamine kinase-like BadF-type ATPase
MFKQCAGLGGRITLVGIVATAGTGTVWFDDKDDGVVMANAAGTGTVWFDEKDDGVVIVDCS